MNTFGRVAILIVSAVLTGCMGCVDPGQPTPNRIATGRAWFPDKSTCECHYLLQVRDTQSVDNQTTRVRAMVHPTKAGALHTQYTFLVNKDEASLKALAAQAKADKEDLVFYGCRDTEVDPEKGQEFVLNVEREKK
jgi:hypothetical protein